MSRGSKPTSAKPASAKSGAAKPAARPAAKSIAKPVVKPAVKPAREAREPFSKPPGLFARLKSLFRRGDADAPPLLKAEVKSSSKSSKNRPGSRRALVSSDNGSTRIVSALKEVLDRDARSRSVLVHLALVERALERRGSLEDVPPEVLRKALSQLETLVTDWSQGSIAALRAQIKSAMTQPVGQGKGRKSVAPNPSPDHQDSRLEVNEASVTTFMEARAQWERSATGGR